MQLSQLLLAKHCPIQMKFAATFYETIYDKIYLQQIFGFRSRFCQMYFNIMQKVQSIQAEKLLKMNSVCHVSHEWKEITYQVQSHIMKQNGCTNGSRKSFRIQHKMLQSHFYQHISLVLIWAISASSVFTSFAHNRYKQLD